MSRHETSAARFALMALAAVLFQSALEAAPPEPLNSASQSIRSDDLLRHIRTLSSDEFEGRGPGTRGEDLTVRYLVDQFQKLGLKPGNPDGSFIQKVPLMGISSESTVSIQTGGKKLELALPGDAIATSLVSSSLKWCVRASLYTWCLPLVR